MRRDCWLSFDLLNFGEFADHFAFEVIEADATGVADGYAQGPNEKVGALEVDLVTHDGVDGFHQSYLDGFLVFD